MSDYAFLIIAQAMEALGVEYEPFRYTGISDDYWVGSYSEVTSVSENGQTETNFFLTGFTRSSWMDLQTVKNRVEQYFTREGRSFVSDFGSTVIVAYDNAYPIPKEDSELKSIQINLTIKEWKVR